MAGQPRARALRLAREIVDKERAREGLPAAWDGWEAHERLQWMLGLSLTQAAHVCMWDVNTLDMGRLSIWDRVRHGLWMVTLRLQELDDRRRQQMDATDQAAMEALARRLKGETDDDGT